MSRSLLLKGSELTIGGKHLTSEDGIELLVPLF